MKKISIFLTISGLDVLKVLANFSDINVQEKSSGKTFEGNLVKLQVKHLCKNV